MTNRSTSNSLRGKVVLIDFWAYSCINCQRAIPHVVGWYQAYRDNGFEVIGVHTPEYAFEKVTGQRRQRRGRPGHHLSGRAGQQLLDLDELPQPVLAGRVSDRRERHGAAHRVRRRRLQRHREADPTAAHRSASRASKLPRPVDAADTTPKSGLDAGDVLRRRQDRQLRRRRRLRRRVGDLQLSADRARRQFRSEWPVVAGLPGRDGRQRRLGDQAQLPRQRRLRRRRRHRRTHRDAQRHVKHAADQRSADLASDLSPATRWRPATLEVRPSRGLQIYSFTYG